LEKSNLNKTKKNQKRNNIKRKRKEKEKKEKINYVMFLGRGPTNHSGCKANCS
jgi:hypothetical protein